MISAKVKIQVSLDRVVAKVRNTSIKNLRQAGAYIRGIARKSIKVSAKSGAPGKPPRTRKGRLKDAILFDVEKQKQQVVIGPSATEVGRIGGTHERGGTEPPKIKKTRQPNWKLQVGGHGPVRQTADGVVVGKLTTLVQVSRAREIAQSLQTSAPTATAKPKARKYPARPFMGPAFDIAKERLPKLWAGSVK